MSDQLKKYLQQSKEKLDTAEPRFDMFNQIMDNVEKSDTRKPGLSISWITFMYSIAAALALLVVASFLFTTQLPKTRIESSPSVVSTAASSISPDEKSQNPIFVTKVNDVKTSKPFTRKTKTTPQINNWVTEEVVLESKDVEAAPKSKADNTKEVVQVIQKEISFETMLDVKDENPKPHTTEIFPSVSPQHTLAASTSYLAAREEQQLNRKVKKGLFNLFSRKARKWSGETIQIERRENDQQSFLAFQFKSGDFEFSKSIRLNTSQH